MYMYSQCTCSLRKFLVTDSGECLAYTHLESQVPVVPNCMLTCNMRNEFVPVRVYQAVKNPATTDEFVADFSSMQE